MDKVNFKSLNVKKCREILQNISHKLPDLYSEMGFFSDKLATHWSDFFNNLVKENGTVYSDDKLDSVPSGKSAEFVSESSESDGETTNDQGPSKHNASDLILDEAQQTKTKRIRERYISDSSNLPLAKKSKKANILVDPKKIPMHQTSEFYKYYEDRLYKSTICNLRNSIQLNLADFPNDKFERYLEFNTQIGRNNSTNVYYFIQKHILMRDMLIERDVNFFNRNKDKNNCKLDLFNSIFSGDYLFSGGYQHFLKLDLIYHLVEIQGFKRLYNLTEPFKFLYNDNFTLCKIVKCKANEEYWKNPDSSKEYVFQYSSIALHKKTVESVGFIDSDSDQDNNSLEDHLAFLNK